MFQNEISDKLQHFAQQGMDRETVEKVVRKRRRVKRSMSNSDRDHMKSQQLKLF
ncbi:MAG: hypothetical protein WBM43_00505 [Flavobacteriaceae bacterium]